MRWSYEIGRLSGIPLRVHVTFLLLLLFEFLTEGGLAGVLFTVMVFAVVVLHELGHALAARRYGIPTRDITLLPFGGLARLDRMPTRPSEELVVALAGPAVNVGLALLGGGALAATLLVPALSFALPFTLRFLLVNVGLAVFNLLPVFPMDGGRVFRALLATKLPLLRATQIAARTGRFFAAGLALLGVFVNPMLILVAAFVWAAGKSEELMAAARAHPAPLELGPGEVRYWVYDANGRLVAVSGRRV